MEGREMTLGELQARLNDLEIRSFQMEPVLRFGRSPQVGITMGMVSRAGRMIMVQASDREMTVAIVIALQKAREFRNEEAGGSDAE